MKLSIIPILLLAIGTINSCSGQNSNIDTITFEAYSSYNNTTLSSPINVSSLPKKYDSTINYALGYLGLPNIDIEVVTTNDFGAFSLINRQTLRRFFVYNPAFFDSVYQVTQTNYAILSICFHELAHQFYRHPLKPSYASHLYEKQADRYSGFAMAMIGATLKQSLIAMQKFGNDSISPTHPDIASRLYQIEKGFIDARIKIFKDSSYIKQDSILKMQELMYVYNENIAFSENQGMEYSSDTVYAYLKKAKKKSKSKVIYTFYGDLIYLTSDNEIKLLSNNKSIGDVLQPNPKLKSKILNLEGVKFYLEQNKIYSLNPDGFKMEIGNKITN
jgi:hypothetical protein